MTNHSRIANTSACRIMTRRPKRTAEERDERLVEQAFGNLRMANPTITREQVAERLRIKRAAEAKNEKLILTR